MWSIVLYEILDGNIFLINNENQSLMQNTLWWDFPYASFIIFLNNWHLKKKKIGKLFRRMCYNGKHFEWPEGKTKSFKKMVF